MLATGSTDEWLQRRWPARGLYVCYSYGHKYISMGLHFGMIDNGIDYNFPLPLRRNTKKSVDEEYVIILSMT